MSIQSTDSGEQSGLARRLAVGRSWLRGDHKILSKAYTAAAAVALLVAALPSDSLAQRAGGPFAEFAGAWNGGGRIEMQNGRGERIRCRAWYSVSQGGAALVQDLRCASDSYRIELNSSIQSDEGSLSGTWTEHTRNVTGTLSGHAGRSSIQARVNAMGFSAGVTVNTAGNSQSVTIMPEGNEVRSVAVTMKRG
jgi:hypothetical protein